MRRAFAESFRPPKWAELSSSTCGVWATGFWTGRALRLPLVGSEVTDEDRKCPMCGGTKWILLDGVSTLMALEGGLEAIAYSCDECGFMRWHRRDKVEA